MILYKYCDERGIDLLKNMRIKISPLSDVNDPFEFLPQLGESEDLDRLLRQLYDYQRENYRILSLSEAECNVVMWGHYCNKHRGILYKIDASKMVSDEELNDIFVKVNYKLERPKIVAEALAKALVEKDTAQLKENLKLITRTKFEDWKYEKECRAIFKYDPEEGYNYHDISPDAIIEVVLGMDATWETETLVRAVLQDRAFSHVKLKKARKDHQRYSLVYDDY